ncbi:surp module domain-containing protein [Cardiosporidium cionae]|uniref:Surp module domain-containing protein n=1 Tax=Cardiosporidium cionae TaxID=476202 RepID=A0ABQ7JGK6_9APIC|nr:surp module domain-containing protein [Cardiosporidium cionae]|eukprot:KAF8822790.1 surp module domain-containing protein [Cardiosporidium cionae]
MSVIPASALPGGTPLLPSPSASLPMAPSPSLTPVGIIFPPADLRGIIDKTAQFVAKNGPEFESRVMREKNNQRFSFLFPNNPYRPYYELKVQEFKTGVEEVAKPAVPQAILDMKHKEEEKTKRKEQLLALTQFSDIEQELKPPEPDQYAVAHPYITPVDIDVIKTAAQFVARNGQRFLSGLTQRERNNPQFDFLKPSHALFGYFTSLVDSYTKCLLPPEEQIEKLKEIVQDIRIPFEKCYLQYRWETSQEKQRKEKEDAHAQERVQMASIDWHDFIVVETINFTTEDDSLPLAAPVDFSSTQAKRLPPPLEKIVVTTNGDVQPPGDPTEEVGRGDVEMEEEDMEMDIELQERMPHEKPTEEAAEASPLTPSAPLEQPPPEPPLPEDTKSEIKVVSGYTRAKRHAQGQPKMQKCPLTGQMIPADEMTAHLNTLLLDPRWKEELDRRKEKARKQNTFAPTGDVGSYLSAFATKRPDMFGSVEEEIKEHSDAFGIEAAAGSSSYDPHKGTTHQFSHLQPENSFIPIPPPPSVPMPPPALPVDPEATMASHAKRIRREVEESSQEQPMATPQPQGPVRYTLNCIAGGGLPAQQLQIEADISLSIQNFKESLIEAGLQKGLLANQLELKAVSSGASLEDKHTLASYQLGPDSVMEISVKSSSQFS